MGNPNGNKVELIGVYGSDETHALSAWTSTSRDLTEDKRKRVPQLLNMLAENEHHTVFEKKFFAFFDHDRHRVSHSCSQAQNRRISQCRVSTVQGAKGRQVLCSN